MLRSAFNIAKRQRQNGQIADPLVRRPLQVRYSGMAGKRVTMLRQQVDCDLGKSTYEIRIYLAFL